MKYLYQPCRYHNHIMRIIAPLCTSSTSAVHQNQINLNLFAFGCISCNFCTSQAACILQLQITVIVIVLVTTITHYTMTLTLLQLQITVPKVQVQAHHQEASQATIVCMYIQHTVHHTVLLLLHTYTCFPSIVIVIVIVTTRRSSIIINIITIIPLPLLDQYQYQTLSL